MHRDTPQDDGRDPVKTVEVSRARLDSCVEDAQKERIVLTRDGQPVALLIGLDEEQRQLGSRDRFWELMTERRRQPTISRAELERQLDESGSA